MKYFVTLPSGREHVVEITEGATGAVALSVDGVAMEADAATTDGSPGRGSARGATSVRIGASMTELWLEGEPPAVGVIANGRRFFAKVETERMRIHAAERGGSSATEGTVRSPMPGRVLRVLVAEGAEVKAGEAVVVVEAMKMENELAAAISGKVAKILVSTGATVESGAALVEITP